MKENFLKEFLDGRVEIYNQPSFIKHDPISVPHQFTKKQDIEIAGFFASVFAWGNRTTIIRKSKALMLMMDDSPYDFCLNHTLRGLKKMTGFKHRTFNTTDLLYFVAFLKFHYTENESLETAFFPSSRPAQRMTGNPAAVEEALRRFHDYFFSLHPVPSRTRKHIASPQKKSTCKRLNMFLRWMVRKDKNGVDFGIWKSISPSQLICPIDLHVARVARRLGLLERKQTDWTAAQELTGYLRTLDKEDPVKYDFALFGLGVTEKF